MPVEKFQQTAALLLFHSDDVGGKQLINENQFFAALRMGAYNRMLNRWIVLYGLRQLLTAPGSARLSLKP
jgi:hypothetical protein